MAVQPPPSPSPPVPPMSSRSLSCRGPLLASPRLGHLPGAPPGVGSAGRQRLDHVLWAAGRGPRAGAASRGAWLPEAPPGPPAPLPALPGSDFRAPGLRPLRLAAGTPPHNSPGTALDHPWGTLPGRALSPAPRRPVSQNPGRHRGRLLLLPALPPEPCDPFLPLISCSGPRTPGDPDQGPTPHPAQLFCGPSLPLTRPQQSDLLGAPSGRPEDHAPPKRT